MDKWLINKKGNLSEQSADTVMHNYFDYFNYGLKPVSPKMYFL